MGVKQRQSGRDTGSHRQTQADSLDMVGGAWRRPMMKVYDYNQDVGGNYYQPMLQYLNQKETYGLFHTRQDVYLPERAEICSNKYTNLRYGDKSSASHNLDQFLENAYSKQIKELNGSTAMIRVKLMKDIVTDRRKPHSPLDNNNTSFNSVRLLKGSPLGQEAVNHYISELSIEKKHRKKDAEKRRKHLVKIEAFDDEFEYHHKLFGDGAVNRDEKFHNPQKVLDYVNQIRRV